jgi:hypothetical protein
MEEPCSPCNTDTYAKDPKSCPEELSRKDTLRNRVLRATLIHMQKTPRPTRQYVRLVLFLGLVSDKDIRGIRRNRQVREEGEGGAGGGRKKTKKTNQAKKSDILAWSYIACLAIVSCLLCRGVLFYLATQFKTLGPCPSFIPLL